MFGRSKAPRPAQPPATPFLHADNCRTPDAAPSWGYTGEGRFERTCTCDTNVWYQPTPAPAVVAVPERHRHEPGCTAAAIVKTDDLNGEQYTRCHACQTSTHYIDVSGDDPERLIGLVL